MKLRDKLPLSFSLESSCQVIWWWWHIDVALFTSVSSPHEASYLLKTSLYFSLPPSWWHSRTSHWHLQLLNCRNLGTHCVTFDLQQCNCWEIRLHHCGGCVWEIHLPKHCVTLYLLQSWSLVPFIWVTKGCHTNPSLLLWLLTDFACMKHNHTCKSSPYIFLTAPMMISLILNTLTNAWQRSPIWERERDQDTDEEMLFPLFAFPNRSSMSTSRFKWIPNWNIAPDSIRFPTPPPPRGEG